MAAKNPASNRQGIAGGSQDAHPRHDFAAWQADEQAKARRSHGIAPDPYLPTGARLAILDEAIREADRRIRAMERVLAARPALEAKPWPAHVPKLDAETINRQLAEGYARCCAALYDSGRKQ